jgi:hypothetical protein
VLAESFSVGGSSLIGDMMTSRSPVARAVVRPANPSTSLTRDRLIGGRGIVDLALEEEVHASRSKPLNLGA